MVGFRIRKRQGEGLGQDDSVTSVQLTSMESTVQTVHVQLVSV